jgi:hypothetical protein
VHPTWYPELEPLDPAEEPLVELPLLGLVPRAQRLAEHRRTVADRATGHRRAGHGSRTATLVSDDGDRVVLAPIGDRRGP